MDFVTHLHLTGEKSLVVPVKGRQVSLGPPSSGPSNGGRSSPFQGRLLQETEKGGWLWSSRGVGSSGAHSSRCNPSGPRALQGVQTHSLS